MPASVRPGAHVVIGSGSVGRHIASHLAAAGADVRVVTRSGIAIDDAVPLVCDASNPESLARTIGEAAVVYNAANPSRYHRWHREWPPLAACILAAAESVGAVLATVSNLYPYGRVEGRIHEGLPLEPVSLNGRVRRDMWRSALDAHEAGRVRVVEARGSDYVGRGVQSFVAGMTAALRDGKSPRGLGDPSLPHSWTYPGDLAATLIAAANDDAALGRAWHAVTNEPRSQQELADDLADAAGVERQRVRPMSKAALWAARPLVPITRPVYSLLYQYEDPFVIDDSAARAAFGLEPTPWVEVVAETAADRRPLRIR